MRLGYSITPAHSRERSPADVASDAGFDYVQAGGHHVTADRHYFQNIPTLTRLTEAFDHVAALALLPIHDPVVIAEQWGTLAAFADRFELWCVLGDEDAEFDAFGVPKAERVPQFVESLELLEALWSDDEVTFDGGFRTLEGVSVNLTASPEWICIAGRAEPAVRRAGQLVDGWVAGTESHSALERKRE